MDRVERILRGLERIIEELQPPKDLFDSIVLNGKLAKARGAASEILRREREFDEKNKA
jgi:hypothetical protein